MWLFSLFISNKFSKIEVRAESIAVVQQLNLLVLVPTAVMARSFDFNPLKTKIRNFSKELLSLYHIPEVITISIF